MATAAPSPRNGPDSSDLQAQIDALQPWFHNLHLPGGVQTAPGHPLGDFPSFKWACIAPWIPADLSGWNVLDIGCNAGFYSFQLAARGARVTAIDHDPHYLRQARWAAEQLQLGDRIDFRQTQLYELAREPERYDLVWFMGVLYHLRHPLLALDIVRRKTRRMMVMQTLTLPGEQVATAPRDISIDQRQQLLQPGWPVMAFIEHRLAQDPTNWWAPNHACVLAMLRSSGFDVHDRIADETYLCVPGNSGLDTMVSAELDAATGQ
ncbi:MAG: TIGR04290 family methyltransferase [Pseudomonadota bacterium]|nr:TIGR04290 family methyltransferase [Pseudomonadota bacterium]